MIRRLALALLAALALGPAPAAAEEFTSYAIVREDGSMAIAGRVVQLYGIYIPDTGVTCRTFTSPAQCGSRAALALEFKTGSQFVTCREVAGLADGSVSAVCWTWSDEEDLAAYLIRQGWALARPEAPFEYAALERIAERQGIGVWGFPVDRFKLRRHRHW